MSERYRSVLMFGPPGVGKGTQGKLLGCIPGMWHLATGDMFRALDRESPLGQKFTEYSTQGLLVPDDLTIQLWKEHVQNLVDHEKYDPTTDLLVLDGIPRSVNQAKILEPHIDVLGVIHLGCPDREEMVRRITGRAKQQGRRDDADESVIRRRLQVFEDETAPVLDCFDPSVVYGVDAMGGPATVLLRILNIVAPLYDKAFGNPLG